MKYVVMASIILSLYALLAAYRLTRVQGPDLRPKPHVVKLNVKPGEAGFTS